MPVHPDDVRILLIQPKPEVVLDLWIVRSDDVEADLQSLEGQIGIARHSFDEAMKRSLVLRLLLAVARPNSHNYVVIKIRQTRFKLPKTRPQRLTRLQRLIRWSFWAERSPKPVLNGSAEIRYLIYRTMCGEQYSLRSSCRLFSA